MSSQYFWKEGIVLELDDACKAWPHDTDGHFCVDSDHTDPGMRYGTYCPQWEHISYERFPPEFKLHLLILGVT